MKIHIESARKLKYIQLAIFAICVFPPHLHYNIKLHKPLIKKRKTIHNRIFHNPLNILYESAINKQYEQRI